MVVHLVGINSAGIGGCFAGERRRRQWPEREKATWGGGAWRGGGVGGGGGSRLALFSLFCTDFSGSLSLSLSLFSFFFPLLFVLLLPEFPLVLFPLLFDVF